MAQSLPGFRAVPHHWEHWTVTEASIAHDVDRRALLAVAGLFVANGALVGGVGATLPAMRLRLGVDAGGLAVLLVAMATAAVVSMQIGGRLADSRGARNVALPASVLLVAGVASLAFAPTLPTALAAAALTGLGNGAMDVSMNALGVRVEQAREKPVMSRLHASFSIGNLVAAGAVLLTARLAGDGARVVTPALITLSAVSLVALLAISRRVPSGSREVLVTSQVGGGRSFTTGRSVGAFVLLLGAMAFSFGLAEGIAIDWSSVHVTDVALVDPSTGALGLVAVSSFMILIRLFGDRAVASFGRVNVVRFGGLVAAGGYLATILGQSLAVLLVGWSLVGLGVGMIAPQVYAVAGHAGGGRMLAVVVTFGYGAFLIGPAIVGALVRAVGIRHAMAFPLVLSLVLVALSRVLSRSEPWEDGERPASLAIPESPRILR
jgi:MFS family permease